MLERLRELHEISAMEIEAVSAWNSNNAEKVIDIFFAVISLDGSTASTRLRLGMLYFDEGEYKKAIPFLEEYPLLPKTWSETVVSLNATIYLAGANYFIGNNENFKKYTLAVEEESLGESGQIHIRKKFSEWGISY